MHCDSYESHCFLCCSSFPFSLTMTRWWKAPFLLLLLSLFTFRRSGEAEESSGGARRGGGRVSDRDRGAIVPGRGGGGGQAAALLRGSHRPMQARNQKQRRQKAQQRRRRGAFSSGHGETGSGPKDITNQGPARDQKNEAVCVLITKAASLSWFLVMLVLTEVGGGWRGGSPVEKRCAGAEAGRVCPKIVNREKMRHAVDNAHDRFIIAVIVSWNWNDPKKFLVYIICAS